MEARGWEADLGLNSFPYLLTLSLTLLSRCLSVGTSVPARPSLPFVRIHLTANR
jgi:hypothetical protein